MPSEALYTDVKVHELALKGRKFMVAEPPVIQGRLHRRVIGGAQDSSAHSQAIDGKPLLYVDTYLAGGKTYTYARHKGTPKVFFSRLDSLIFEHEELRQRHFPSYITVDNEMFYVSLPFPMMALLEDDPGNSIRFFKTLLPFGELSIQFGDVRATKDNQRIWCQKEHTLTKAVESPIIGFQSDEENRRSFLPIFTQLHWASDHIYSDILELLINEIAPAVATA